MLLKKSEDAAAAVLSFAFLGKLAMVNLQRKESGGNKIKHDFINIGHLIGCRMKRKFSTSAWYYIIYLAGTGM
jgi:hypothetical protein